MKYRKIFDSFEKIVVQDELAKFLGVNEDGVIEFSYIDIIKCAGHSCGTVAGAYLIALKGLKALYKEELPKRGEIKVEIKRAPREENAGVIGSVLSNITGASVDLGFGGIPTGAFNRRDTLFFKVDMQEDVRLTRLDTHERVAINYRPGKVVNPMSILMSAIAPDATQADKDSFADRFQEMVQTLFKNADTVIEINPIS
ncbi:hypothetical protein [Sulfurospirillum sp. 1612]|uniref:hypothetical protein n=1 Tax=Sulfurospirillum sp. 1612 TaxID=3094835 RepID=UPI002F91FBB2